MKHQYGHWLSEFEIDSERHFGFIYIITNRITDQKYIGKRNFIIKSKHYCDWMNYISSSQELKKDIKMLGKENFIFKILELHKLNNILSKREVELQKENNVLYKKLPNGEKEYYNKAIHNVGFNTTGQPRSQKTRDAVDGSIFYYNPLTNECRRIKDINDIPENFVKGRPPKVFEERIDKMLFYDSITGSQKWLSHTESIPLGYIKGGSANQHLPFKRGNDNIMADKTIYRFHNISTDEIFSGTQCEFKDYTGLPNWVSNVICGKKQKSSKNWRLALDTQYSL